MNIKVAAFTVSEKSSQTHSLIFDKLCKTNPNEVIRVKHGLEHETCLRYKDLKFVACCSEKDNCFI